MKTTFPIGRLHVIAMTLGLVCLVAPAEVPGQSTGEMTLGQPQNDASIPSPRPTLRRLFTENDFFASDTGDAERSMRDSHETLAQDSGEEDSLADLLRRARISDDPANGDRPEDESPAPSQLAELADDEPTGSLLEDASDAEPSKSEAEEAREAQLARQRAMAAHLHRLQKPVREIRLAVATTRDQVGPDNRAVQVTGHQSQQWITETGVQRPAADRYSVPFCHRPLYFEQIDLERCGNHYGCLQNAVSAGYFLVNTAFLPYRLGTQCCDDKVPTRGDCRTCESFSTNIEPLACCGLKPKGLITQAAALAGFTFLVL
ncbi:MAG: hypothetical protein HKN47_13485 [Pirellulaceae bacterium]|nr:hypothetical protein [Pirellulaceae bacterium]